MNKSTAAATSARVTIRTWDERSAAEGCPAVVDVICVPSQEDGAKDTASDSYSRRQTLDFDHLPESCVDPDPAAAVAVSSYSSDLGEQKDGGLRAEGSLLLRALPSGCYQSETTPGELLDFEESLVGDNYVLSSHDEVSKLQARSGTEKRPVILSHVDMKGSVVSRSRCNIAENIDRRDCISSLSVQSTSQHHDSSIRSQAGPELEVEEDVAAGNGRQGIYPVQIVQMEMGQQGRAAVEEMQATRVDDSSGTEPRQYIAQQQVSHKINSDQRIEAHSRINPSERESSGLVECRNPNVKMGSESIQENFQGFCRQLLTPEGPTVTSSLVNSSHKVEPAKTLTFAIVGTAEMVDGAVPKRVTEEHKQTKQQPTTKPHSGLVTKTTLNDASKSHPKSCDAEAMAVIEQLDLSLSEALLDSSGGKLQHCKDNSRLDPQQDNLVEEIFVTNPISKHHVGQNSVSHNGSPKVCSEDQESTNKRMSDAQTNTDFSDVYIGVKRITCPSPVINSDGQVANVKLRDKSKLRDDRNRIYRMSWRSLCNNDTNTLPKVTVAKVEKKDVMNRHSTPIIDVHPVTSISSDQKMNTLNTKKGRPRYQERAVDVDGLELNRIRSSKSESSTPTTNDNKRHSLPNSTRKAMQQEVRSVPATTVIVAATKESKEILNNQTTFNGASPNNAKEASLHQSSNPSVVNVDVHNGNTSGLEGAVVATSSSVNGVDPRKATHHQGHFVVVAIDFGTTFSGYAFSFTRDPENIHMMRKWEGGDPGVINQKTPTCLLLTPDGEFHSFGFTARDHFHNMDAQEAKAWLYFDKFKMTLHHNTTLNRDTKLSAANGKTLSALTIFGHALRYFKNHALMELSDQSATEILNEDVRWVITVPAIWRQPAKQFMRQAAYEAGIACQEYPDQLLIALEPEAASIYCRKLRMNQLIPEGPGVGRFSLVPPKIETNENAVPAIEDIEQGLRTRYIVVDCGGGTVDITVHEMADRSGSLKELYKATGGPHGSVGVDLEFENLLNDIFGADFIEQFKLKRPAAFVELMTAFEARKRGASPYKNSPLNISLPFSFIDYYRKCKGSSVENAIKKLGNKDVRWSAQGMLRLEPDAMSQLFRPVITHIISHIGQVVKNIESTTIRYLFLVGGFAESQILQHQIREIFGNRFRVVIPQGVSLAILRGAVLYGLDPTIVCVRRSRMTYGVGVLNRFIPNVHPREKCIRRDKEEWCIDVFDKFVLTDQSVGLGDTILRSYTPANSGQKQIVLHIYCSENDQARFVTDAGVKRCGTLNLDLTDTQYVEMPKRREIQMRMIFGDTEIKVSALDVVTQKFVRAEIDFLNL